MAGPTVRTRYRDEDDEGGIVMEQQRPNWRGRVVRAISAAVAITVLGAGQAAFAAPDKHGWHGLGWDLPALQQWKSVVGKAAAQWGSAPHSDTSDKALKQPPAVSWPAAADAVVDLPATGSDTAAPAPKAAGKLPVQVTRGHGRDPKSGRYEPRTDVPVGVAHEAGQVRVETVDHGIAEKAGIRGTLLQVSAVAGDVSGPISLSLNYHDFAAAYGADFGQRLQLAQYPACVLSTPEKAECRTATPLDFANVAKDQQLVGEVTLPQQVVRQGTVPSAVTTGSTATGTVVGATSGTNSGGGAFTATNLSPSGSWSSGTSTGEFTYSYPIALPESLGDKAPVVSLQYSSGSVDGLTSSTNNQPSWVGDGWDLSAAGFIERSYQPCAQDLGGNNGQTKTGDMCWATDNATMSLGGSSVALVKDTTSGQWHPRDDDGSRVEKLTGAANGAQGGEYWRVTTTDGTQYTFGLNHLPGWQTGNPETQSTWTEPVFGNNPGEPCYQSTFANSWCQQAWRWNLDYVVDPHGNATTYYYQPETNYYGLNLNTTSPGTQYTRGGNLDHIEYGFNTNVGTVYSQAPFRVRFDTAERCIPSGSVTCDPSQLTSGTASSWPDVPVDQICAQGANCPNVSPSFFTRKRLTAINTEVSNGSGGWSAVNQWTLNHSFPNTGDGSSPALWLSSITHTGKAGTAITLPPTTFNGLAMANRVDATSNYTAITRYRINSVVNEQGGVVSVNYSGPECVAGSNMPSAPESNTLRCYPSYWTPGGATAPVLDWFNKYVVTDITDDGRTQLSQQVLTHYDYLGGGAWHYDENLLGDPQYRTWSQWRGYGTVKTTKGQATTDPAGPPTVTQALFLRGMDGDTLPGGGTRTVTVTDALGEQSTDIKQLPGFTRETLTYLSGQVIEATVNDPWVSAATATDANGTQSFHTGTSAVRNRSWLAASNTWRNTQTLTTYNAQGLVTQTEDDGDVSDASQATCTRYTYAQNTTAWLLNYKSKTEKVAGTCATTASSSTIVAQTLSYFDGAATANWATQQPTKGDVTQAQEIDTWPSGGNPTYLTTSAAFDVYGRAVSQTDAIGRTTTTAYTPATGGPVTQVATTTPQISSTNTTKLTSTNVYDPVSGVLVTQTDGSGLRTDATYDALGRLTAVWPPGHDKSVNAPAAATYGYTINTTSPSVVATGSLQSNGNYTMSYALVDGLGRTIQSQAPTSYAQGGRVVTDSLYDSQGRKWKTHNPYWNGDSTPASTLLVVQDNAVPSTTAITFDSAGRDSVTAYQLYGTEQWRTSAVYDGDRVTTTPPAGDTPRTAVMNGLGQRVSLLQYTGQAGPGLPADTTTYKYTPAGQLASITDSTGKNTWTNQYDLHGRKVSSNDPDTGANSFTYDGAGQLLTKTDARGRTLAYTYDNLGRKTAEYDGSTSGTKLAIWNYDTLVPGLPTSSVRFLSGKPYTTAITGYDTAGRVLGKKITIPLSETGLGGNYTFSTAYDQYTGAVLRSSSPSAGGLPDETVFQSYDTLGSPTTAYAATSSGTGVTLVSETDYNPYGQVLRNNFADTTDPNQVSVTNTYEDGTNRLSSTLAHRATTSNYAIANKAYTYDPAGNITKIADTPQDGTADTQCFTYDYLRRLTGAWTPSSGDCTAAPAVSALGGAAPYWTSWSYDKTGNRLTQVQHASAGDTTSTSAYPQPGQAQPHAVQSVSVTGPGGNSATNYTYDQAGNTATRGPTGASTTFTYDAEGRIATSVDASGKTTTYQYDADGNQLFVRDATGVTLTIGDTELFVAAGTTSAVGTRFYTVAGKLVAERNATTGLRWTLTDHQGTTYATVEASNLAVTQRRQDPFGNSRGSGPSSWPDKHGFVGGYQQPSGLTHLGARDYDPLTGRFTQVDPVLDTDNPQQMNGYAYSNNSPVTNSDANGLAFKQCPDGECAGGGYPTGNRAANPAPSHSPAPPPARGSGPTLTITGEECGGPAHKRFINPNNNANEAGFLQTITTIKYTGELYIPKPCPDQDICQAVTILVTWEEAVAVTTTPYTCHDNDTTPGCGPFVTNGPMPGKEALEGVGKLIFDPAKCVGSGASIGGCALEVAGVFPWGKGVKAIETVADGLKAVDAAKVATEAPKVSKGPIEDVVPRNLPEELALGVAKQGQGEIIMRNLGDAPRLAANYGDGEWVKMQYVLRGNYSNVTVHCFRNLTTGTDVEFKFK